MRWKRKRSDRPKRRMVALTDRQRQNARKALRHLRAQHGGQHPLAAALGVSKTTVAQGCGSYPICIELVVRMSRLAGVPLEDILAGELPPIPKCQICGFCC